MNLSDIDTSPEAQQEAINEMAGIEFEVEESNGQKFLTHYPYEVGDKTSGTLHAVKVTRIA